MCKSKCKKQYRLENWRVSCFKIPPAYCAHGILEGNFEMQQMKRSSERCTKASYI